MSTTKSLMRDALRTFEYNQNKYDLKDCVLAAITEINEDKILSFAVSQINLAEYAILYRIEELKKQYGE